MKIVGKFRFDNVLYGIGIKDNKCYAGRIIGNKLDTYLSDDEKALVDFVFDSIRPGDNVVKVEPVVINNNKYDVFYDLKKNFFTFSPVPVLDDLKHLNYTFNNQSWLFYDKDTKNDGKKKQEKPNLLKRIIKYMNRPIIFLGTYSCLLLVVSITQVSWPAHELFRIREDFVDNEVVYALVDELYQESKTKFSYELAEVALKNNTYLSDEEKSFIMQSFDMLADNKDYLLFDSTFNRLGNLKIRYSSDFRYNELRNVTVLGSYNRRTNTITIYQTDSFKNADKLVLTHEVFHVYQNPYYFNRFFTEGINSIMADEYSDYHDTYLDQKRLIKGLNLIVGSDVLKKMNFISDDDCLLRALYEVIPDEDFNNQFIALTYEVMKLDVLSEEYKNIIKRLESMLAVYYEAKYNRNVEDDLVALMYINPDVFADYVRETTGISDCYDDEVLIFEGNPPLFNKDNIINKWYKIFWGDFSNSDKVCFSVIIDEDNRYLNKNVTR